METCSKCPNRATCIEPCEKIESQLESVFQPEAPFRTEIPLSNTKKAKKKYDGDGDGDKETVKCTIDDFREIDPGALYGADTDQTVIWDEKETIQGTVEYNEPDSDPEVLKKINDCINNVVRDTKLNRRYRAYLGCDKMTAIAERAGVKKQTIQKQFARITNRISEMYEKRHGEAVSNIPFKLKKAGGACRIELKK